MPDCLNSIAVCGQSKDNSLYTKWSSMCIHRNKYMLLYLIYMFIAFNLCHKADSKVQKYIIIRSCSYISDKAGVDTREIQWGYRKKLWWPVGGGISGLSVAYYLSKAVKSSTTKVLLLEGSNRLGGWVESTRTQDGAVFDHGPRSVRGAGREGYNTLRLVEDLGLSSDILPICSNHPAATNRFIYANKGLCMLPNSMFAILRRHPPFSKSLLRQCWKEPFTKKEDLQDDSVHNFFQRRFGSEVAKYIASPLCRGIYAGDSKQLGMKGCFKRPFDWEQQSGSVIRGVIRAKKDKQGLPKGELIDRFKSEKWSMWSLRKGLQQLTEALETELSQSSNVQILRDTPCDRVEFVNDKAKIYSGDSTFEVDHVVSTILANKLGPMLEDNHRLLAVNLKSIPTVTVGVVHLEYKGNKLPHLGFGHLIPSSEPSKVLGSIYQSSIFPEHSQDEGGDVTRVVNMLGGAWFTEYFGEPDDCSLSDLEDAAVRGSAQQLGITEDPVRVITRLHKDCIPQYVVGHTEVVGRLEDYIREKSLPLSLVGSSYKGVSVNDCIHNAKLEAENLAQAYV